MLIIKIPAFLFTFLTLTKYYLLYRLFLVNIWSILIANMWCLSCFNWNKPFMITHFWWNYSVIIIVLTNINSDLELAHFDLLFKFKWQLLRMGRHFSRPILCNSKRHQKLIYFKNQNTKENFGKCVIPFFKAFNVLILMTIGVTKMAFNFFKIGIFRYLTFIE